MRFSLIMLTGDRLVLHTEAPIKATNAHIEARATESKQIRFMWYSKYYFLSSSDSTFVQIRQCLSLLFVHCQN